jgi:hypothetical protein
MFIRTADSGVYLSISFNQYLSERISRLNHLCLNLQMMTMVAIEKIGMNIHCDQPHFSAGYMYSFMNQVEQIPLFRIFYCLDNDPMSKTNRTADFSPYLFCQG